MVNTQDDNLLPQIQSDDSLVAASGDFIKQPDALTASNPTDLSGTNNLPAADADIIEKEWVDRAKHLVEQTLHDPYKQQQALSDIKTSYMKKRFNKNLGKSDS